MNYVKIQVSFLPVMEEAKIEEYRKKVSSLEMPESIRTPGRTWTRYPDVDEEKLEVKDSIDVEVSTEGDVDVFRGEEALERAEERFFELLNREENKLTALHTAYMNSIIYLKAEGKSKVAISYKEDSPVFTHLVAETGQGAELELTEGFRGDPEIQTSFNEFFLGDNSTVNYGAVESIDSGLSYSKRHASVGRDAKINWLNSQFGGDLNRTEIETVLSGDNSSTEMKGVWYPVDDQHFDISLKVRHIGDNTECDMDSRAVVDNQARSVYEGLQKVGETAGQTKSFQDEKALMLSDRAEADASPKLMIENPDVEASHAASTGNIPENELHYMESRGISQEAAQKMVVKGYFEPVMEEIEFEDLKDVIRKEVRSKLQR